MNKRNYLDQAATSFPKPEEVYTAVEDYSRHLGSAVGRSGYRTATKVQTTVDRCRKKIADFLGAESANRIVFTFNGTDSLNLAIHGLLQERDHVITTVCEHNSVLRPLNTLKRSKNVELTVLDADSQGRVNPQDVKQAVQSQTKLVVMTHASNVTGSIQPLEQVGDICRENDLVFLVDAAQTVGHLPIDLRNLPVDLLAAPGHKGLLGPLGTGILYLRSGMEDRIASLRQGGTGTNSEQDTQPDELPQKYESGNHNAPGICGLEKAVDFLLERGIENLRQHEIRLTELLLDRLKSIPNIIVPGTVEAQHRVGVISVTVNEMEPQIVSSILDESFGIETRAGLHCAPLMHHAMGTDLLGGTVRFSIGPFTTEEEIEVASKALASICQSV